ncbi:MAG: CPBP family intramembrane metalloprotease [Xanthomonadales bacterium]|nr:CPBP family intramembrane metalloprotease [Xanthomonadales bacterium]
MNSAQHPTIGLRRQLLACGVMSCAATAVILLFRPRPYLPTLLAGFPLGAQAAIGFAFAGIYWFASVVGFKFIANRETTRNIAESYSRLELKGFNPFWVCVAAGFGEELLFRGALQPLIGVWLASVLFVLLHTQAYRFNKFNKRMFLQAAMLFAVSVALGFIAMYVGLVAAMLVHAGLDVVGLYSVRRIAGAAAVATQLVNQADR